MIKLDKRLLFYNKVFWQLFYTDILIFNKVAISKFIDTVIWFVCVTVVSCYIFPKLGMPQEYGPFYAIGMIVSCSFWEIWSSSTAFVADLDGNKTITYPLTLPIPSWLVFLEKAFGYAFRSSVNSIILFPLSKLFLMETLDLSHMSVFKFILIFFVVNFFSAFFSVFITSIVKDMNHVDRIGIRFLFPIWFLGGSQFSWDTLLNFSPWLAYVNLFNPLLYCMEGMRAAVLGQAGYINFYLSVFVLILFSIALGLLGIINFKKRLDFV